MNTTYQVELGVIFTSWMVSIDRGKMAARQAQKQKNDCQEHSDRKLDTKI